MTFPDLKQGNLVYPAYDAKGGRCTVCRVTEVIDSTTIKVKGVFWGDYHRKEIEAIFKYKQDEDEYEPSWQSWIKYDENPTLMEMLDVTDEEEEGDYYSLKDPSIFTLEWFNADYLEKLGILNK